MSVGSRYSFRIEIVRPGTERTNHEAIPFEGLMRRRRQMKTSDTRLEVVDANGPGIIETIPADNVKRVIGKHHLRQRVGLLHYQPELARFVMRLQVLRSAYVALSVWTRLRQLTELV